MTFVGNRNETDCSSDVVKWRPHLIVDTMEYEDMSQECFINDIWIVVGPVEIVTKVFIFLPVVLSGIFGNTALVYVLARNRHLCTPNNLLVGNMAVADWMSLLVHPVTFLINDFFQNYQFGEFGCKVEGAFECALLITGVMNLCAISYDRLTVIVLPRETRLTRRGTKIVMAITWILGFVIAAPLIVYRTYKERQWADFLEKYCTEDTVAINIYWFVIITMMVWVPLTIMSICYITIFIKLSRYEKKVKNQIKSVIQVKYKAKVAKTMFFVVVAFLICHLPFTVQIIYRSQLLENEDTVSSKEVQNQVNGAYTALWCLSKYMIFLNASINPIVYGLMNEKFQKVFKKTFILRSIFIKNPKTRKEVTQVASNKSQKSDRSKRTDSCETDSVQGKCFTIFKPKCKSKAILKEVTISEDRNKIISI